MMVCAVKYLTFKKLDLSGTTTSTNKAVAVLTIGTVVILRENLLTFALPVLFTAYLIVGFARPRIARWMRREMPPGPVRS
jgi:hypothetical protein